MAEIPSPYTGNDKYIFISYAHKDKADVFPIIEKLNQHGFRVWFDDGIDPGTEWDDNIAAHIEACDSFIAFITREYLESENCKDELNYARDLGKNRLLVYLEDVSLPRGMAMRLNRIQALFMYRYPQKSEFYHRLFVVPMLQSSKISNNYIDEESRRIGIITNNQQKQENIQEKYKIDNNEICVQSPLKTTFSIEEENNTHNKKLQQKDNDLDGDSKSIIDGFCDVTVIDKYSYKDFDNIRSIRLHKGIAGLGMQTFRYCRDLERIDVDPENLYFCSVDGVLFNKSQTKLLCYPAGRDGIRYKVPDTVVSIDNFAFSGSHLVHIELSKRLRKIGDCSFEGCTKLKGIVFPETLEEIGHVAFQGCSSIKTLNIPANVEYITFPAFPENVISFVVDDTNKEFISEDGILYSKDKTVLFRFPGAKAIREFIIPHSVRELASDAFSACKIQRIVVPETVTKIGRYCFSHMNKEQTVYLPESLLNSYSDEIRSLSKATFVGTTEPMQETDKESNSTKIEDI